MNPGRAPPPGEPNEEVLALIATLHATGQRLEELTAGEVDTVANRDGRTFVLQRAQEQLRHIETARQAASLAALAQSELRFRQLADNIREVFFLQNLDSSQIFYVSPAYEHIWGRTCESLYATPASWGEAIHPDDLARSSAAFIAGRDTGFDYEFRIIRPDGGLRWIHVRGFPVLDGAGNPYRTAGVASDITQRRMADEVLRKRAAELERFHRLSVGRELQMVELKKQVNQLAAQAGQKPPYDLAFLGPPAVET